MTRPSRVTAALLLVLAAGALGACARRGAPVAPELRVPAVVRELDALVRVQGIEVSWVNPSRRADGTPLRDLTAVHVFRSEDTGAGDAKPAFLRRGQIAGYTEVATIRLAAPAPAVVAGGRVTLVDRQGVTRGRRYTYVVLGEDSTGRTSPPSDRLSVDFVAVPEPPGQVSAEPAEGEARVTWSAPTRLSDGSPAPGGLAYEVFRGSGPEAPLVVLPGPPIPTTSIVDRPLENDRLYEYAVRAVRVDGRTKAVSELTPRIRVTPADMTPPSPPGDLVAIPSERTVRLSWKASPEPDVARYIVYRAPAGGDWQRVGSVVTPGTTFVERDVPRGRWRYAVSAEDAGSRRNESARSSDVTVSVP